MPIAFKKLKAYRKQSGMTQEEVAEKLGVSRQAVAKWERGETLPDIESCMGLADLYGTTLDLLVRNLDKEDQNGKKHIFGLTRMNDKGQIILPRSCRKVFGLNKGDMLLVLGDEDRGLALIKLGTPGFTDISDIEEDI